MCLAIPGEITSLHQREGLPFAMVRFGGISREVCLACQPDAGLGDFVLVHVGLAIARIDREEAARAWQTLAELGQLNEIDDTEEAPGLQDLPQLQAAGPAAPHPSPAHGQGQRQKGDSV
jgi:hydrogenase expression/formation protein HypC